MSALQSMHATLWILLPELILMLVAAVMMTVCAFVNWPRRNWAIIAAVATGVAIWALKATGGEVADPYSAPVINDALAHQAKLILLMGGLALIGISHNQIDEDRGGEFFGALLLVNVGAMLVACGNDLILMFVGLELVSIPTYFLLFFAKRDDSGREAAAKYFFLSLLASAVLLFGFAYLYGLTGTSNLKALAYLLRANPDAVPAHASQLGLIAVLFIMGGLAFRIAAVPFHFYAPDVYEGASTALAGMLAWVPKAIGFLAMIRLLTAVIGGEGILARDGAILAWAMAAATLTLGNAMALFQDNLKRLLAYSSIAHAGYLLMAVVASFASPPGVEAVDRLPMGTEAIVYYLTAYGFMTLGAFAAIVGWGRAGGKEVSRVDDLAGFGRSRPWSALGMAICLLSLAGIPFTLGFWGKLEVFGAIIAVGWRMVGDGESGGAYLLLAVIGALNAAIGAYYYLRLVVVMYFREPTVSASGSTSTSASAAHAEPHPFPLATGLVLMSCAVVSGLGGLPIASDHLAERSRGAAISAAQLPDPLAAPQSASR